MDEYSVPGIHLLCGSVCVCVYQVRHPLVMNTITVPLLMCTHVCHDIHVSSDLTGLPYKERHGNYSFPNDYTIQTCGWQTIDQ